MLRRRFLFTTRYDTDLSCACHQAVSYNYNARQLNDRPYIKPVDKMTTNGATDIFESVSFNNMSYISIEFYIILSRWWGR